MQLHRITFVLFATLLCWGGKSLTAQAQGLSFGIRNGLSISGLKVKNGHKNDTRWAYTGGFSLDYNLNKHFVLGADVLYAPRGVHNDRWVIGIGGMRAKVSNQYDLEYLSVPLKAGFQLGKKLKGTLFIGVVPSGLLVAYRKVGSDDTSGETKDQVTGDYKRFDMAGMLELNGDYQIKERYSIGVSVNAQQSFTEVRKNLTNYSYTFSLRLMRHF